MVKLWPKPAPACSSVLQRVRRRGPRALCPAPKHQTYCTKSEVRQGVSDIIYIMPYHIMLSYEGPYDQFSCHGVILSFA